MQDDSKLAGECHFGELHSAPLAIRIATSQTGPAPVMHQNVRCLIESRAYDFVATATDVAIVVDLPGAVATWR